MLAGTLVMLAVRVLGVVVICAGGEGEGVLASLQGLPSPPGPGWSPGRQDECLENGGQHSQFVSLTFCTTGVSTEINYLGIYIVKASHLVILSVSL